MLFLLASAEDDEIIEKLYNKYKWLMYNIAYDIIGDSYLAEDIVQISMEKLSVNIKKINLIFENKTRNYIFTITRNTALTYYRSNTKYIRNNILNDNVFDLIDAEGKTDFQPIYDKFDFGEALEHILEGFDITDKDILRMKYGLELNEYEIASALNIKYETVRKRLYRAKQKIKKAIEKGETNVRYIRKKAELILQNVGIEMNNAVDRFLDAYECRIKKIGRKKRIKNFFRIVAVVTIFSLVAVSITIFSVEALRSKVMSYLFDEKSTHTEITYNEEKNVKSKPIETIWNITYIPDGFKYISNDDDENTISSIYYNSNSDQYISFTQSWVGAWEINIDNEHTVMRDAVINGCDAKVYESEFGEAVTVIWQDADMLLELQCISNSKEKVAVNEIVRAAESVNLLE